MRIILPALISIAFAAQGAESPLTKETLDKQFRGKIVAFYHSQDFAHTPMHDLNQQLAELARSVYAAHPDILKESAKKAFLALPPIKPDDIPPADNPIVLPVADFMKTNPKNSAEGFKAYLASKEGGTLFLNNFEAVPASKMAMQMAITQNQPDAQLVGKRMMLTGYARDVFHRLNEDFLHLKIAVQSLGEWFVIDLDWNEIGFYFPSRIEWRRKA
jgi:hypothetical protein